MAMGVVPISALYMGSLLDNMLRVSQLIGINSLVECYGNFVMFVPNVCMIPRSAK